jgi:hypothetical protein
MPAIIPNKKEFSAVFQPVLKQLQRAIPSYPNHALACPFPVWKTITIGGKTPHELYRELGRGGIRVYEPMVKHILCNNILPTLPIPQRLSLVRTTFMDTGFTEQPRREELLNTELLSMLGLDVCPAETVPNLMYQYPNEEYSLDVYVVAKPICFSNYSHPNHRVFLEVLDPAGNTVPWFYTDVPEYIDSIVFTPRGCKFRRLITESEYDGQSLTWKPDNELIFALRT